MATKATARRPGPSVTVLHGIGFNAYKVEPHLWVIKTVATRPGVPTAIVSTRIHSREIVAKLREYSDAAVRLMYAEGSVRAA